MMYLMSLVMILIMFIYMLFYFLSYKMELNMESLSSYECGFNMMKSARIMFSYRFYLIGILFLIFDVEIVLLLISPFMMISLSSMLVFSLFLMILIMGLMYEYYLGSLEWL